MKVTESEDFTKEQIGIICSQVVKLSIENEKLKSDKKAIEKQLTLTSVGVTLPRLVVESHEGKVMSYLEGIKGIVAVGDTKQKSVNRLMLLIKVKLLYDLGN